MNALRGGTERARRKDEGAKDGVTMRSDDEERGGGERRRRRMDSRTREYLIEGMARSRSGICGVGGKGRRNVNWTWAPHGVYAYLSICRIGGVFCICFV